MKQQLSDRMEDMAVGGKVKQIREHVRRNKKVYMAGAGGLAIGAFGVGAFTHGDKIRTIAINWKSPHAANTVTTILERRGHPGYIVKCKETGELFASQARAAAANGVSSSTLSNHLTGLRSNAGGLSFERIGEAL